MSDSNSEYFDANERNSPSGSPSSVPSAAELPVRSSNIALLTDTTSSSTETEGRRVERPENSSQSTSNMEKLAKDEASSSELESPGSKDVSKEDNDAFKKRISLTIDENKVVPPGETKLATIDSKLEKSSNGTSKPNEERGGEEKKSKDEAQTYNDNDIWNGKIYSSDRVEAKSNGLAVHEKPKRIFQAPPEEEYLPVLSEEGEEEVLISPDGGWGWMVVFASFMIHVFADGFTYTLGIFYVHLRSYFGVSRAAAAWIVSILVGVTLGSGPIAGGLVNKFGCRTVTIAGALVASFMLFVSIFAANIATLYFTIGIGAGFGFGLIYLPAIVCVTGYFEKKRSFATGIAVCGSGLGTFVFSPLVEHLIAAYNWKGAMMVISGLVLNCVFFGALFRPLEDDPINRRKKRPQYSTQYSVEDPTSVNAFHGHKPPRIQVSSNDDCDRQSNCSEAPSGTLTPPTRLGRSRGPRSTVTGSIPGGYLDIQRIKSHGHLNPTIAALRMGGDSEAALRVSVSQPLFQKHEGSGDRSPSPNKMMGSHSGLLNRRKDIFYRGSLLNIPEYKENPTGYRDSIVRRPDGELGPEQEENHKVMGCIPCSRETRTAIHSLTDFGLLTDPIFQLFAVSNFLTSIGFYAPYVFIVDRALEIGILSEKTATLLAVVGISNTVSRVVLGYISDMPWINRLYLYNAALTICGLGTCASIWMNSFSSQVVYAAIFGSTSGAYVGLTSVVLVDLLGMEKLTNAFGLLLLAQGIASVIGPPICGSLYDMSQNYDYTFLLAGSMIAVSGLMLFAIPFMKASKYRTQAPARDHDLDEGNTV